MIVVTLVLLAPAVHAQDMSASLRQFAQNYLDEIIAAAKNQSTKGRDETDPAFIALFDQDRRWMNPVLKPGIGRVATHMAIYGATRALAGDVTLAEDAARVSSSLTYDLFPGINWPAEIDFIRVNGKWRIRAIRLVMRRPLPVTARPDAVVAAYFNDIQAAAARQARLGKDSWLGQTWGRRWSIGGGGYWRPASDCKKGAREGCLKALLGGTAVWSALMQKHEKTVKIGRFKATGDVAVAEIAVRIRRRSTVDERRFQIKLLRDRRHGWQVSSLEARKKAQAEGATELDIDASGGLTLVASLLKALTGPDAPNAAALMANPAVLKPYFENTRDGRKALARAMTLKSFLTVYGAKDGSEIVEDLGGGRIQVTFSKARPTMPALLFTIAQGARGARIKGMESR